MTYYGDSRPEDQAADAAMADLYRQLNNQDLPDDPAFDTEAGLRDIASRVHREHTEPAHADQAWRRPARTGARSAEAGRVPLLAWPSVRTGGDPAVPAGRRAGWKGPRPDGFGPGGPARAVPPEAKSGTLQDEHLADEGTASAPGGPDAGQPPPAFSQLASTLAALTAPPSPTELRDEAGAMSAFRDTAGNPHGAEAAPSRELRGARKTVMALRATVSARPGIAVIVIVLGAGLCAWTVKMGIDPIVPAAIGAWAAAAAIALLAENRQGKRRRTQTGLERHQLMRDGRQECATLLRMTRELEAAVRDHGGSRSPDKALRGQEIRELATDLAGQAQKVGLLVSALGTMAAALSDEAIRLAAIVMSWENTASGTPAQPADTVRLERHLTDFKRAALTVFYSGRAITNGPPIADELQRELAM